MKIKGLLGLVVLYGMSLLSCGNPTESAEHNMLELNELPELSVFHLPGQWTDQHSEQYELSQLQGDVLVMVMIYTSCKAACPRLVADMKNIESKIDTKYLDQIKLILVSIDPKTDTPERLLEFSIENEMTEAQWVFLNGTEDDVRSLANVLAMKYKQISPIDFSHSNIISVFDQQGVMQHQQEGLGVDNEETISAIIDLVQH